MPVTDFPSQVYVQPAPAVAGDWASTNPRAFALAGPGGLVAGPSGVVIALWAWANMPDDQDGAPAVLNNFYSGPTYPGTQATLPLGVIHREMQALITAYLGSASMTVPAGFQCPSVVTAGDVWVKNSGANQALPGMKCFADTLTGQSFFGNTGTSPVTATVTGTLTAATASFTGSITDDVLTVTALASGTLVVGTVLGTLGGVAANSEIVALGSGTGTVGTYLLSIAEQTVAGTLMSGSSSILNVTATSSGSIGVGTVVSGTGVSGTVGNISGAVAVRSLGTGTGGNGTYNTNGPSQSVGSSTLTGTNTIELKWYARSSGLAGELVKISSWPIG